MIYLMVDGPFKVAAYSMSTILTVTSLGRVPELALESHQTGNLAASSPKLNEDTDPQLTEQ